jgi:hypothetical protein
MKLKNKMKKSKKELNKEKINNFKTESLLHQIVIQIFWENSLKWVT